MDLVITEPDGREAAYTDSIKLVSSRVRLGIMMEGQAHPPADIATSIKVIERAYLVYSGLDRSLRYHGADKLEFKVISIEQQSGRFTANVLFGETWFMASNMDEVGHTLGQADLRLMDMTEAWRKAGWNLFDKPRLVHPMRELLPKWLIQGCKDRRMPLQVSTTYIEPKTRYKR